jgi:DNA repair exonuclease SbcCD nuclease subunit
MNKVQFLHLADLHIGLGTSAFDESTAQKLKEKRFEALDRALKLAAAEEVEFMVIAGDLFEDNGVSREDAERIFNNLEHKAFKVYVLPGNHDPLLPGSVWERMPWKHSAGTSIVLLDRREPACIREGVALYPCTVFKKNDIRDPTAWIPPREASEEIRIAIAHGSVHDRDTLAHDDHLIDPKCFKTRGLDYVALGHWHSYHDYRDAGGQVRMAYPGTHEQMNFARTGSAPSANEYFEADEFRGGSEGQCLLVKITREGGRSTVEVQPEKTGCLVWEAREYDNVNDERLREIFSALGRESETERRLLRLTLKGMVSLEGRAGIPALKTMIEGRHFYAELDVTGLLTRPEPEEVRKMLGDGMLLKVHDELARHQDEDAASAGGLLSECIFTLYQLAREVQK